MLRRPFYMDPVALCFRFVRPSVRACVRVQAQALSYRLAVSFVVAIRLFISCRPCVILRIDWNCEYAIATFFAYLSKVRISHIFFRINWHFRRQL